MINETIVSIYEDYLKEVQKVASEDTRRFGGLTRMFTGKPSVTESLLPQFDDKVQNELFTLSQQQPGSAAIRELAEWMLEQFNAKRDDPQIKYSLMAVQRHLKPLIGFLGPEDAFCLAEEYEGAFPRHERFPSHVELIAGLREQSGKK